MSNLVLKKYIKNLNLISFNSFLYHILADTKVFELFTKDFRKKK